MKQIGNVYSLDGILMKSILFILMVSLATSSAAKSTEPVDIEKVFRMVDTVAMVQIVESKLIVSSKDDFQCGVKYKAKVIEPIKGVELGDYIYFGNNLGYPVGEKSLMLIKTVEEEWQAIPNVSLKSDYVKKMYIEYCDGLLEKNTVWSNGLGSFPIGFNSRTEMEYLKMWDHIFKLPKSILSGYERNRVPKQMEVNKNAFMKYLKTLQIKSESK